MEATAGMKMAVKKKVKEQYLKIPYHILNIQALGLCEKVLLAHIYSFGRKGCWQSNATLAEIFMTKERTMSRWIQAIKKYIYIKNSKSYYRTMWAKSHPDVKASASLSYRDRKVSKIQTDTISDYAKNGEHVRQKLRSEYAKNGFRVRQNCPTTNNNTIKETIEKTIAAPSPLPAGGQAPAPLEDRKRGLHEELEDFKRGFGFGPSRTRPIPTQEQLEQRRQTQIRALMPDKRINIVSARTKPPPSADEFEHRRCEQLAALAAVEQCSLASL
jgi:hypothetical protein